MAIRYIDGILISPTGNTYIDGILIIPLAIHTLPDNPIRSWHLDNPTGNKTLGLLFPTRQSINSVATILMAVSDDGNI